VELTRRRAAETRASTGRRASATALRFASAAAIAGGLLAPSVARAQPATPAQSAKAHALFEQARALMIAGRYAEACPKFEESHRAEEAPGTLLNLADCYERIGRGASAWELYLEVAQFAKSVRLAQREEQKRTPQSEEQKRDAQKRMALLEKREAFARDRAGALEPKLSRLRVTVNAAAVGMTVQRDGIVLSAAEWGAAVPVDPGQHVVEASAPNKWDFRVMRYVPPGPSVVTVDVPALVDQASAIPKAAPKEAPPKAVTAKEAPPKAAASNEAATKEATPKEAGPQAPSADAQAAGSWQKPVGYTMTGVGFAALGAGVVLLVHTSSDAQNQNNSWEQPVAYAAITAAGALLVTGLYFVFSAPSAKAPPANTGSGALLVW
jgi:tetratricopeptide (TPR) repeat protein